MEDYERKDKLDGETQNGNTDIAPASDNAYGGGHTAENGQAEGGSQYHTPKDGTARFESDKELSLYPSDTALPSDESAVYRWDYSSARSADSKRKKKKERSGALVYCAVVSCAFIICLAIIVFMLVADVGTKTVTGPEVIEKVKDRVVYVREYDSESGVLTTQEIYDKCLPSVVSIIVSDGSVSGSGSGFIMTEDGYIITANHVIEDMTNIRVVLSNGELYTAKVIDGNAYTDIALIKIEKNGLTPLKIGSSDSLLVGDSVVAIGTPVSLDFAGSLAEGEVSYKNRMLKVTNEKGTAIEKKMRLIQTNALVNPGNSGCPLINEYGEVVGIVTMKLKSTYYEGMCFAIPIDAAMPIINAMKDGKSYKELLSAVSVAPAVLGIMGENAYIEEADINGIRITEFSSYTYDASSKLMENDIITHINGIEVMTITELKMVLDSMNPGETVVLDIYRGGQTFKVSVVLGS